MTQIAAKLVKELRDKTGVGMMDAKKAWQKLVARATVLQLKD